MLIPALRWEISDTELTLIFLSVSSITWLGMQGHTLDITILLAGLMSLRVWITCSLIVIVCVTSRRESSICLVERKIQKRLFDIRDTKTIFLGEIILPMATI